MKETIIDAAKIARINELYHKSKAEGLTDAEKKEQQQSVVDKANLMALCLTAGDTLLVNGKPMQVSQLKEETIRFVHRLGKKHLISIESDRDADYNLYFQMQNQLMEAYLG